MALAETIARMQRPLAEGEDSGVGSLGNEDDPNSLV